MRRLALAAVALAVGCRRPPPPPVDDGPIFLDVGDFVQAYKNDASKADARFRGEIITIAGVASDVIPGNQRCTVLLRDGTYMKFAESADCPPKGDKVSMRCLVDYGAKLHQCETVNVNGKPYKSK